MDKKGNNTMNLKKLSSDESDKYTKPPECVDKICHTS